MSIQDFRDMAKDAGWQEEAEPLTNFFARALEDQKQVAAVNQLLVRAVIAFANGEAQAIRNYDYPEVAYATAIGEAQQLVKPTTKTGMVILLKASKFGDFDHLKLESYPDQEGNMFLSAKQTFAPKLALVQDAPVPEGVALAIAPMPAPVE